MAGLVKLLHMLKYEQQRSKNDEITTRGAKTWITPQVPQVVPKNHVENNSTHEYGIKIMNRRQKLTSSMVIYVGYSIGIDRVSRND